MKQWSQLRLPRYCDDVIIPTGKTITIGSSGAVAKNIAINAGTLNIVATGSLTVSNAITNNGTLTIASDASNSGSVIVGSYSGNTATYQRYLTGSEWHLFSTPLSAGAQTIADFVTNYSGAMTQSGVQYSLGTYDNNFVADGFSTWQNYTTGGSGVDQDPHLVYAIGQSHTSLIKPVNIDDIGYATLVKSITETFIESELSSTGGLEDFDFEEVDIDEDENLGLPNEEGT